MSILTRRTFAVVLPGFAVLAFGAVAFAAPARAPVVNRPAAVGGPSRGGAPLLVRRTFTVSAFRLQTFKAAPVRALPLVAPRAPLTILPGILPRLAIATFLPRALGGAECAAAANPPALFTALPTPSYMPVVCQRDWSMRSGDSGRPTALTAGGNKNALYGPDFVPHVDIP